MKRIALTLLATVALIATGCGDTEKKDDYVKAVNKVNTSYAASVQRVAADLASATDADEIATKLDQQADVIAKAADELDAIKPPDDAKTGHAKLVNGTRKTGDEFAAAAKDAKSGDLSAATEELANGAGAKEYADGLAELKKAGYKQEK